MSQWSPIGHQQLHSCPIREPSGRLWLSSSSPPWWGILAVANWGPCLTAKAVGWVGGTDEILGVHISPAQEPYYKHMWCAERSTVSPVALLKTTPSFPQPATSVIPSSPTRFKKSLLYPHHPCTPNTDCAQHPNPSLLSSSWWFALYRYV